MTCTVFQVLTTVRYLTVPFPYLLCQLDYLLKNIGVQKGLIFVDFILILRYFFTFHSKNPTAIQDDFWIMFLNMWAVGMKILGRLMSTLKVFQLQNHVLIYFKVNYCLLVGKKNYVFILGHDVFFLFFTLFVYHKAQSV